METPSKWREEAEWIRENASWLRHSQQIAVKVLLKIKVLHLTQKALAERMNYTQQYVSKILKGKENLSLDTMTRLEALEISLVYPEANAFLPSQVAEKVYVQNKHPQTSDSLEFILYSLGNNVCG